MLDGRGGKEGEGDGGRGREEGYGVLTYMLIKFLYIGTAKKNRDKIRMQICYVVYQCTNNGTPIACLCHRSHQNPDHNIGATYLGRAGAWRVL